MNTVSECALHRSSPQTRWSEKSASAAIREASARRRSRRRGAIPKAEPSETGWPEWPQPADRLAPPERFQEPLPDRKTAPSRKSSYAFSDKSSGLRFCRFLALLPTTSSKYTSVIIVGACIN
jgi:hypothetical protein